MKQRGARIGHNPRTGVTAALPGPNGAARKHCLKMAVREPAANCAQGSETQGKQSE